MLGGNSALSTGLAIRLVIALLCLIGCAPAKKPNTGGNAADETPAYAMPESGGLAASEANPQVVHGDVFEDYHYAIRLRRPSSDWRFMDSGKVQSVNPDASMGLVHPVKQAYMLLIAEPMQDVTLEKYVDLALENVPLPAAAEAERVRGEVGGYPSLFVK